MCSRIIQPTKEQIMSALNINDLYHEDYIDVSPGERAYPGNYVWGVVNSKDNESRVLSAFRYGTDKNVPGEMYNARIETVSTLRAWKAWYRSNRCVVPVSAFFEQSKYIHFHGASFEYAAAIFDRHPARLAILTMQAIDPIVRIHPRVPVFVPAELLDTYLDRDNTDPDEIRNKLYAYQPDFDLNAA